MTHLELHTHTQTFEPGTHLHNNRGFWGPISASIDWCERNYIVTYYIAEFWNTTSNVFMLLLGLWGLYQCLKYKHEARFVATFGGIVIIAVGSAAFHGTLLHVAQQGDETPMIYTIFSWLYSLLWMDPVQEARNQTLRKFTVFLFFAICAVWTVVHYIYSFVAVFQGFFASITIFALLFLIRECQRCRGDTAAALGITYVLALGIASILWILDCQFCRELHTLPYDLPNPQFHGWWHFLVGVSCYVGPLFLCYRRASLLGRKPEVVFMCKFLPYISLPSVEEPTSIEAKKMQ